MRPVHVLLGLTLWASGVGLPPALADNRDDYRHRDCENNEGHCEDNDSVVVAPVICVEPGSCRFG